MLVFALSGFVPKIAQVAFAQEADVTINENGALLNGSTQVVSAENVGNIGDSIITPRWITYEPRIGWTKAEDYSGLSYDDKAVTYSSNGGTISVKSGYINEELWAINAKDASGASSRLVPVSGVSAPNNIFANGATTVTISNLQAPIAICVYTNDSRKMKELTSSLLVSGNNTKVGGGKVLYRSMSTSGAWGAWSFTDLSSSVSLTFTQTNVQMAVIYEIKETGRVFLDPDIYYRIAGFYRFNIA